MSNLIRKIDMEEFEDFVQEKMPEDSKIYVGCDSYRKKSKGVWYAHYTTVVVVHKGGRYGCRVFGEIDKERDYDHDKSKPFTRMMNEVYRAVAMLEKIGPVIGNRQVEVHLDINPNEKHGSNVALQSAVGYVLGVTGLTKDYVKVKPDSFIATHCADHFREYL